MEEVRDTWKERWKAGICDGGQSSNVTGTSFTADKSSGMYEKHHMLGVNLHCCLYG